MHTLRLRVALQTTGHRVSFLVTKDVLQLLHNFIFELRALIGVECLGWFKDIKYPFYKSFRTSLLFFVRKCDEHSKPSEMIDIISLYEHYSPVWDTAFHLYLTRSIEKHWNKRPTGR